MKILISSYNFYPDIGGIETVTSILAHEFTNLGHEVKLITQTLATDAKAFPFEVIRQPQQQQLFRLVGWCDIFFHNNISLKAFWPLLLIHRPWVVMHQTWIYGVNGSLRWQDHLKRFLIRFATSISISQAVADHLSSPSKVIGNCYCDDIFYEIPEISRTKELVFLGRLVSDKGVDLLIMALGQLQFQGLFPHLTIIGTGPEDKFLRSLTREVGVSNQVNFTGQKTGSELVHLLNMHQIMVVPSRWSEPFGVVALEGIACGCVVVGSEQGGLKDAIGPCGITFLNGDIEALTQIIASLLLHPHLLSLYKEKADTHLSRHKRNAVAKACIQVFENAIK